MEKFLEIVTQDLLKRGNQSLEQYIIITPGKRPRAFLKHIISQKTDKPVLTPLMFTINEFIEHTAGLRIIDNIPAIAQLYKLYNIKSGQKESIENFWFFGEMLLNDFDDVDKYLVDAANLFHYVKDLKEIEQLFSHEDDENIALIKQFWESLYRGSGINDEQKIRHQFLKFWKLLHPLYIDFKKQLQAQGMGYEGMLYREVAQLAKNEKLTFEQKTPVFIGFNALSKAEKAIFKAAQQNNGLFYWDYDEWYISNHKHEAGYFMRKNLEEFPNAITVQNYFQGIKNIDQIKAYGAPGELEMARIVASELENNTKPVSDPLNNGVILANESLLTPILQTLNSSYNNINITMGLPLANTGLFAFLQQLLKLQANQKVHKNRVYYKSHWVISILKLPFHQDAKRLELIEKIRSQNIFFADAEMLGQNEWLQLLFPQQKMPVNDYIQHILKHLVNTNFAKKPETEQINAEAAIQAYKSINQLTEKLQALDVAIPENLFIRLINKIFSNLSLTLEGEPLRGTQLMGLIETRTLDFDHLIIAGANEGCLPSSSVASSFIPYNLRKANGLLTFENQDAIFAYYFYRAIQRSRKLTLVYNNNDADKDYGEKSRFLQQLEYEWKGNFTQSSYTHAIAPQSSNEIIIPKTKDVWKTLQTYLDGTRSFYPVQLNAFMNCPLQFYFRYIAQLKEPEDIESVIDYRIFGLIFHDTMEMLYKPFSENKQIITASDINSLLNDNLILAHIRKNMRRTFEDLELRLQDNGQLALIEQVVLRYVKRVLQNDREGGEFLLPGLENKLTCSFAFDGQKVTLAGKIDRMQIIKNQLFIVDYKTGKAPREKPDFDQMFAYDEPKRSNAVFQAMMYTRIVEAQNFAQDKTLIPSLLYIQENKPIEAISFANMKNAGYSDLRENFENGLQKIFSDLFDKTSPLTQTTNTEQCRICAYKSICHRHE